MKMHFLIDYLAYISVRLLSLIFIAMPTNLAVSVGKAIGTLAYYIDVKHKAVAYDNISFVFASKTIPERKLIVKHLFQNFALSLIELLRLPVVTDKYFDKYIEIVGRDNIENAVKQGKGLIFLAVHFGSWELSNIICAKLGLTYKVIAREQKRFLRLGKLLNSYRQSQGAVVVTRGISTREVVKSLSKNEVVGMVADQGGKDGYLIDFFGKDASMPTGAIRMALKLDVPVLMAFLVRKNGPFHKVIIEPQLKLIKTENPEQDILINLKNVIQTAEEVIRAYPEQYMWFYKIWKYSLTRSVVILNDGKIGHLRQSQAVAGLLVELLKKRGLNPKLKIVNVNFKNKFSKPLVSFCGLLAKRRHSRGCLWCLKNFMEPRSFEELNKTSADFVISAGEAASPVNYIFSDEKNAKTIVILKPGILGFKRFNLVAVPQHDNPPQRKNVVITKGAPNLISEEYLLKESNSLASSFPDLADNKKPRIGLLLGGDTKKYTLTAEILKNVLSEIKRACLGFDFELLVSTSRRTSKIIEDTLKQELKDFPNCKLLIIANENNHPSAVGGILALAKIIVVSGESISMVSEAATSGNNVIVFRLQPGTGLDLSADKHAIFLQNLDRDGYILAVEAGKITDTIAEILKGQKQTIKLDDNLVLSQALDKII